MKGFKQSIQRLVKKGPEEESNELQNLGNLLKENENHLENIFRNGLKSIRSARLAAEDNHGFGDCLGSFADAVFVDDDHQTGQALRLLSDFLHTSEHRRNDYLRELENRTLFNIKAVVRDDLASAAQQKRKHARIRQAKEHTKLELDAARLNKKITPERRKEIEDMHEAANIAHRESEYETTGVYLDSNKSVEFVVSQGMIDTFEALHSYYGSCLNWLEQKRVVLDQIKEKMKEEEESHAKMRASRAMRTPAQLKRLYEQNVVFGAPLKSLLQREKAAGIDGQIPSAIQQLVDWIRKYGLKEEGIFRISGNQKIVKTWTDNIDLGESLEPILTSSSDVHILCGLFKLYLRELPQPLCTIRLYDSLLDFARIPDEDRDPEKLKNLLLQLPPANYYLLRETFRLSKDVVQFISFNKMSAANMATVMGPNLIHKTEKGQEQSPADLLSSCSFEDIKVISEITIFMIDHCDDVFLDGNPDFLHHAVSVQDNEQVSNLLNEEKMDPNQLHPETKNSPLHTLLSLANPSTDILQALVDGGADINLPGADGLPPVFRAVGSQPEKRAALIHLINLGADIETPCVIQSNPKTLIEFVGEEDPPFYEDIQQVIANTKERKQDDSAKLSLRISADEPQVKFQEQLTTQPRTRNHPFTKSATAATLPVGKPKSPTRSSLMFASPPQGIQQHRREGRTENDSPSKLSSSSSPSPSPLFSSPLPPPLTPAPLPASSLSSLSSSSSSTSSPSISTPSLTSYPSFSSSSSPSLDIEQNKKTEPLPIPGDISPVYQQICLDSLIHSLAKFVAASAHSKFDPNLLEDMNSGLIQLAQSLKMMLTAPGADIRSFADRYSEGTKQQIRKCAQNLQDSAKTLIHSVRQANSEKSDSAQKDLLHNLGSLVVFMRGFFATCELAAGEVIIKETQSLSKCLSEYLTAAKSSTDSAIIKQITGVASVYVLHINQLVKVRALEIPDREIQSKLSKSCAAVASLTSEISKQSLVVLQSPLESRNLEPVGTKAKSIIAEFQTMHNLIQTELPEHYLTFPGSNLLNELKGRTEMALQRTCLILDRAGNNPIYGKAKETLPPLVVSLFDPHTGSGGEFASKVFSMTEIVESLVEAALSGDGEQGAVSEGARHKLEIFKWAIEQHVRTSLLSSCSMAVEIEQGIPLGQMEVSPVVQLPFLLLQLFGCLLQFLVTAFPTPGE